MGDPSKIDDLKPEDQACVRSTRTRVGRTVRGFAMANKLTREVNSLCFFFMFFNDICQI